MASISTLVDRRSSINFHTETSADTSINADSFPVWLDEKFMEKIMRDYYRDLSIKVKKTDVQYAVAKGENYASILYRVRVTFSSKSQKEQITSYIIKAMFEPNTMAAERLGKYNVHEKEMEIYENIIPDLTRLQKSINDNDTLFPEAISINREYNVMIFKDVSEEGYIMADRTQGLDMKHTKLVLQKMAKMHALAAVLQKKKNSIARFETGMFNAKTDAFHSFFFSSIRALTNEVSSWPGYEYYAEKLKGVNTNFLQSASRCYDCDEDDDLGTLAHGDLWVNNVMFKYDKNCQPVDVLILDFQYSSYASPIIDFIYFFYTSTQDEIRQNQQDELVQFYFYELTNILSRLQYPGRIPSLNQFQQKVLKKSFFIFISAMINLPTMINEETKDADFEALMGEDERGNNFKKIVFSNPKLQPILKKLLPALDRKGLFDGI